MVYKIQRLKHIRFVVPLLLVLVLAGCKLLDDELAYALKQAGTNRAELEQVLQHYRNDSLKLKAAEFLIRNMPYHIGIQETMEDLQGRPYLFDFGVFGTSEKVLERRIDSLFACGYKQG